MVGASRAHSSVLQGDAPAAPLREPRRRASPTGDTMIDRPPSLASDLAPAHRSFRTPIPIETGSRASPTAAAAYGAPARAVCARRQGTLNSLADGPTPSPDLTSIVRRRTGLSLPVSGRARGSRCTGRLRWIDRARRRRHQCRARQFSDQLAAQPLCDLGRPTSGDHGLQPPCPVSSFLP